MKTQFPNGVIGFKCSFKEVAWWFSQLGTTSTDHGHPTANTFHFQKMK